MYQWFVVSNEMARSSFNKGLKLSNSLISSKQFFVNGAIFKLSMREMLAKERKGVPRTSELLL